MSFAATGRPLGGPSDRAANLLLLALVAFFVLDAVAVRYATGRRARARSEADRRTYWVIQAAQLGALAVAVTAPRWASGLNIHTATAALAAIGLVMMISATALRVWSVLTLGRFFDRSVTVQGDHRVGTSGPYRWVRHPSYTAVLVAFFGFGVGQANWLSGAVTLVVPTVAYIRRMSVEERELCEELGDDYRDFIATRKRLVPGVY